MKHLMLTVLVAVFSLGTLDTAEAKRFGGGKSFGTQKHSFARQAETPKQTTNQTANTSRQAGAASSGASKWLGPLAGLAAGGLLAALFFGDAFEGLQIMDFLLFGLLAFALFAVFRAMRARQAQQQAAYQYAGHHGAGMESAPAPGAATHGSGFNPARVPLSDAPSWFDEQGFVEGAKSHFLQLQSAWDTGDLEKIREYTTPALYAELVQERQQIGDSRNFTDVLHVEAQLLDLVKKGDAVVASVLYHARVVEEEGQAPQQVQEIWHIRRELNDPEANWYVAGIQQQTH